MESELKIFSLYSLVGHEILGSSKQEYCISTLEYVVREVKCYTANTDGLEVDTDLGFHSKNAVQVYM